MKTSKLLRKATTVYKLTSVFLCCAFLNPQFAHSSTAEEVVGNGNTTAEAQAVAGLNACRARWETDYKELKRACSEAQLGSNIEICKDKIEACEGFEDLDEDEKSEAEYRHCFAATGETKRLKERVERLEKKRDRAEESLDKTKDRLESLTQDYHDATEEVNQVAEERQQAEADLKQELADIDQQKQEAMIQTQDRIESLKAEIYKAQDARVKLLLDERAMWTTNKIACRKKANAASTAVVQRAYAMKRAGTTNLSVYGMLAQSGRSATDEGVIEHNRVMRNCTSIKNPENTKDTTDFGDNYLMMKSQHKAADRQLQRTIRQLERRIKVTQNQVKDQLNLLTNSEKRAISNSIQKQEFLYNKAQQLKEKIINIQYKLRGEALNQMAKENALRSVDTELQEAEAKLTAASVNGSGDDKTQAYHTAVSLIDTAEDRDAANRACNNETAELAEINSDIEDLEVAGSTDPASDTGDIPVPEPISGSTTGGADSGDSNNCESTATSGVSRGCTQP